MGERTAEGQMDGENYQEIFVMELGIQAVEKGLTKMCRGKKLCRNLLVFKSITKCYKKK